MSFFYDLNKKLDSIRATPEVAHKQLNEQVSPLTQVLNERATGDYSAVKAAAGKDIGKPGKNFDKIAAGAAKRYGSEEAGKRVAGAVLNKLRHPKEGVEEAYNPNSVDAENRRGLEASQIANLKKKAAAGDESAKKRLQALKDKKERMGNDFNARMERESAGMDESALQAAFGIKKYGKPGMEKLQQLGREGASEKTKAAARKKFNQYDESQDMADERSDPAVQIINDYDEVVMEFDHLPGRLKDALRGSDFGAVQWLADLSKKHDDIDMSTIEKMIFRNGHVIEVQQYLDDLDEGNAFSKAVVDAKRDGIQPGEQIRVGGKQYKLREANATPQYVPDPVSKPVTKPVAKASAPVYGPGDMEGATAPPAKGKDGRYPIVTAGPHKGKRWSTATPGPTNPAMKEGGIPMTPKQKSFAKLAPPVDKITFADRIVGAKKEVDEMLGDVAAEAMKSALGKGKQPVRGMGEATKEIPGGRVHTAEPGGYGRKDDEDEEGKKVVAKTQRGRGRPKNNASVDTGEVMKPDFSAFSSPVKLKPFTGKITKHKMVGENDMDPEDQGEYDREGDMAKDTIKTVVRHAQALQKILGDNDNLPEWVQAKLAKIEGMMTAVDDYMQNQKSGDMETESVGSFSSGATNPSNPTPAEWAELKRKAAAGDARAQAYVKQGMKRLGSEKYEPGTGDQTGNVAARTGTNLSPSAAGAGRGGAMDEESTNKRDSRAERAGKKVAKDIEYDEKKKDGIHGKRRGSEDSRAEQAGKKVTKDIEYDEKKKKKKEVDETTSSGSVATSVAAPKAAKGMSYGKGIYDSLNRQLENMISESMNINMSMNNDEHGGPRQSLTVTATDEDAVALASMLRMAGMGSDNDRMPHMNNGVVQPEEIEVLDFDDGTDDMAAKLSMHGDHDSEVCSACGSSDCDCNNETMDEDLEDAEQSDAEQSGAGQPPKLPYDVTADGGVDVQKSGSDWVYKSKEPGGRVTVTIPADAANRMLPKLDVDEAYGDTDATDNEPDWPTDEEGTDDAMMYSGGMNGPKSTGQTTVPVIASQQDRQHAYEDAAALRRMMEMAGVDSKDKYEKLNEVGLNLFQPTSGVFGSGPDEYNDKANVNAMNAKYDAMIKKTQQEIEQLKANPTGPGSTSLIQTLEKQVKGLEAEKMHNFTGANADDAANALRKQAIANNELTPGQWLQKATQYFKGKITGQPQPGVEYDRFDTSKQAEKGWTTPTPYKPPVKESDGDTEFKRMLKIAGLR